MGYKAVYEFVEGNPNYLEASPSKNSSTKMSTENVKGKDEKQLKDIRKPKWMSGESSSGLKAGVETSDKNDAPFKSTNDSSTRAKTSSDGDKNLRKESESKATPVDKSSSSSDTDSSEDEKIDDGGDKKKDASKGTIRNASKDLQKKKKVESSSSSSESKSEDEEPMKVQKPSAGATVKDSDTVKESVTAKDGESSFEDSDSDSDTGFDED